MVTRDVFTFRSSTGHVLQQTTMLTSFPEPVFAHNPIWNARPGNVTVAGGPMLCWTALPLWVSSTTLSAWIQYMLLAQEEIERMTNMTLQTRAWNE